MKSTIRIDFAGLGGTDALQPVIRVNLQDSEDVRDGLVASFFQSLGGQSSWLKVDFDFDGQFGKRITIYPVRPGELEETIDIIKNRIAPVKSE